MSNAVLALRRVGFCFLLACLFVACGEARPPSSLEFLVGTGSAETHLPQEPAIQENELAGDSADAGLQEQGMDATATDAAAAPDLPEGIGQEQRPEREPSPAKKERVLLIGDSQFRTHYGPALAKQLLLAGYEVKLIGCGGAAAVHYLGKRRTCVGIEIPPTVTKREPFVTREFATADVARFYKSFPLQTLSAMIRSYKPDHVVVSLGTNSLSPQLVNGFKTIMKQYEQLADVASASASCTWIGPFRLSRKRYASLPEATWQRGVSILRGLVTNSSPCVFLDGLQASKEEDLSSDGLHLGNQTSPQRGGKAVARRLSPALLQSLKRAAGPGKTQLCPAGMVFIPYVNSAGAAKPFCIDAHEAIAEEWRDGKRTGRLYSPYYPPDPVTAKRRYQDWDQRRKTMGSPAAQAMPLPPLPSWYAQAATGSRPAALSRGGVTPQGYLSGTWAARLCQQAGKRLCSRAEWRFACRGPRDKPFPYGSGDKYVQGQCNVHRGEHPAVILHNKASLGHSDPRLNLTRDSQGNPLLKKTGETKTCVVVWPDGKLYDMVGNLDEWVSDRRGALGTFVGGFYSRAQKRGCEASVGVHGFAYSDYSLGVRCCAPVQ